MAQQPLRGEAGKLISRLNKAAGKNADQARGFVRHLRVMGIPPSRILPALNEEAKKLYQP